MIGTSLGDYVLQREIGSGGMGKVYVAEHAALGRRVAVKVLTAGLHDDDTMWRFFNEARAAVQIGHPSIIDVYHFGIDPEGRGYIVMELLAGESLGQRLRRVGRLGLPETLRVARRLASALGAAHRAGVIHRDLKPGNVFLARDEESGEERVKLLDFGIAKLIHALAGPVRTRRNLVLGTPAYMPPEQWRSSTAVDHRADLYALGCMIYEMLSGASPFAGDSHVEAVQAHMFRTPADLGRVVPGLPKALTALVHRMLAKKAEERPVSAEVVMVELEEIERTLRPRRARAVLIGAAAAAAVTVATAGLVCVERPALAAGRLVLQVPRREAPVQVQEVAPSPAPPVVVPPVVVAPAPPVGPKRRTAARPPVPAPAPVPAPETAAAPPDVQGLTADAQAALMRGEPVAALSICRQALEIDASAMQARLICALAACKLHSPERARAFLERVPEARRALIEKNCPALTAGANAPEAAQPRAD